MTDTLIPSTCIPTRYDVSCVPADGIDAILFTITVETRGEGRWAVCRLSRCLNSEGGWDREPIPSSRTDEWLADHRFDLTAAIALAQMAAPNLTCNGFTVADILARREAS